MTFSIGAIERKVNDPECLLYLIKPSTFSLLHVPDQASTHIATTHAKLCEGSDNLQLVE